ncbi:hypothetical protein QBC37DRAFT_407429, partial [Rhypophila decipiens]
AIEIFVKDNATETLRRVQSIVSAGVTFSHIAELTKIPDILRGLTATRPTPLPEVLQMLRLTNATISIPQEGTPRYPLFKTRLRYTAKNPDFGCKESDLLYSAGGREVPLQVRFEDTGRTLVLKGCRLLDSLGYVSPSEIFPSPGQEFFSEGGLGETAVATAVFQRISNVVREWLAAAGDIQNYRCITNNDVNYRAGNNDAMLAIATLYHCADGNLDNLGDAILRTMCTDIYLSSRDLQHGLLNQDSTFSRVPNEMLHTLNHPDMNISDAEGLRWTMGRIGSKRRLVSSELYGWIGLAPEGGWLAFVRPGVLCSRADG